MKVLVTGASGFVGRHAVEALLNRGHRVVAVGRNIDRLRANTWSDRVELIACDLHDPELRAAQLVSGVDVLVHLAWPGLPNYRSAFHFEKNLFADYTFLREALRAGLKHLLVTGTCLEYGLSSGCIDDNDPTFPSLAYPLAKDTLRKFLLLLNAEYTFTLQWVRLFYMYGEGQSAHSLLSQLDVAVDRGAKSFDMSGGEQLRDYLPVSEVGTILTRIAERPDVKGSINCCSGKPVSVRRLVEEHLAKRGADMALNLGVYPYPDYEPMAFWGSRRKLNALLNSETESSESVNDA